MAARHQQGQPAHDARRICFSFVFGGVPGSTCFCFFLGLLWCILPRDVGSLTFCRLIGFSFKPLKVKLSAGEQKVAEFSGPLFINWGLFIRGQHGPFAGRGGGGVGAMDK